MQIQFIPVHIRGLILVAAACALESLAQQPLVVANPTPTPIVGGYSDVSVTNKEVIAATTFAIMAEEKAMPRKAFLHLPERLTLVKIVNAQEQVVAGLNFSLCLQVKVNGTTREAAANVFRALSGERALTSWNWTSPPIHPPSGIFGRVDERGPGVWNVEVASDSGERIAVLQTDKGGSFAVDLEPGSYVLTPTYFPPPSPPGYATPCYALVGPSTRVKVVEYRMTFVVLPISFSLPFVSQPAPGAPVALPLLPSMFVPGVQECGLKALKCE